MKKIFLITFTLFSFSLQASAAGEQSVCGVLQGALSAGQPIEFFMTAVPESYQNGNGPQNLWNIKNPEVLEGLTGSCICVSGEVTAAGELEENPSIIIAHQTTINWGPLADTSVYKENCNIMGRKEQEAHQKKIDDEADAATAQGGLG